MTSSIDRTARTGQTMSAFDRKILMLVVFTSLLAMVFWPAFAVSLPASVIGSFVVSSEPRFVRTICIIAAVINVAVAVAVALYYYKPF